MENKWKYNGLISLPSATHTEIKRYSLPTVVPASSHVSHSPILPFFHSSSGPRHQLQAPL
jgi:hypothetical protein